MRECEDDAVATVGDRRDAAHDDVVTVEHKDAFILYGIMKNANLAADKSTNNFSTIISATKISCTFNFSKQDVTMQADGLILPAFSQNYEKKSGSIHLHPYGALVTQL